MRLTDANDEESKYWKFKHEHFRKGRPELLVNIKKAAHGASSDKQEIAGLRNEMKDLKANVMNLEDEVEELRALVADAMKVAESEVDSKKRKLTAANQQAKPQKIQQLADAPTRLGAFEDVLTGDMDVSCSKPSPHQAVGGLASLVALEDETITAILSQEEYLNIAGLDTTKTTSRSDSKQAEKSEVLSTSSHRVCKFSLSIASLHFMRILELPTSKLTPFHLWLSLQPRKPKIGSLGQGVFPPTDIALS